MRRCAQLDDPLREFLQFTALDRAFAATSGAYCLMHASWQNVCEHAQPCMKTCCSRAMAQDLCELSHRAEGCKAQPTEAIMDGKHLTERGGRAGYDGYNRRKGSKVHISAGTLGHLVMVKVMDADELARPQVGEQAGHTQQVNGENVQRANVGQGYY